MQFKKIAKLFLISNISLLLVGLFAENANAFDPSKAPAETQSVPGNMLLALSVEYPTGLQVAYSSNYSTTTLYDGYFDNRKCYSYSSANEVFTPTSGKNADNSCPTATDWSGNVLNWLTMTNLDEFRSVMTGGTRDNFSSMSVTSPGDSNGANAKTILIRSLSDRNEYFGDKTLNSAWPGVPAAFNGRKSRSGGNGSKFYVHNTAGNTPGTNGNLATRLAKCSDSGIANNSCFNARVAVCEQVAASGTAPAVGREANCIGPYGTSPNTYYKPEGLMQEYANSIRFGAMGYLNQTGQTRDGGVLRARMKSVGATKIGEGGAANANREWNADGTLILNPDSTDATASGVTNSGVINYLNKFGYTSGYKGNDPVGELYYAAQLYFRNTAFPAQYSSGLTDAYKDGFPVITNFADPIIRSCQKNFILGLGDINTHCDGNLPNSPSNGGGTCNNNPNPVDARVDTTSLWNSIKDMEGIGDNGWVGGSTQGKPYIAGLAWWANTTDIRTDLTGKQTIGTYWVDVLENNNGGQGIAAHSQYWLATKYGGFRQDLTTNNSTNPNNALVSWDKDSNGQPDTLFAGNNPAALQTGLRAAFADILARADDSSASSAAVTSNRQTSSSQIIYAGYNPKDWTGSIRSCTPLQSSAQCVASPVWEASRWFDTTYTAGATPKLNNTNRKIITSMNVSGTFSKSAFLWSQLNATEKAALNSTDGLGSDRVTYLRGSRSDEGAKFRTRGASLMGDIVNSNVTYLSGAGPALRGANFSGYATYRAANLNRPAVVYVGANDGKLHALDGSTGKELWAYVPGSVYTKLPSVTNTSFSHNFLVDATAMIGDTETGDTTTPWRTMLVGGLGGGGKAYYALDISRQTADTNGKQFSNMTEAELGNIPMWEFTSAQDSDLGYTYYEPSIDSISGRFNQIAKVASNTLATKTGVWRAILNNGYGSSGNNAVVFFLNTETGAVETKLTATSTGSGDNGLSSPTPVDTDNDGLIDTIYAGDLRGRLHKFQFSKLNPAGTDYILAASGDTDAQWRYVAALYETGAPITAAPVVTNACAGSTGWQVLFGTGKLNENADFTNTDNNLFYSVLDGGTSSSLTVASTDLASITPVTTIVAAGTVRNWSTPSLVGKKGWKMTLPAGERVISNPSLPPDSGAVLFGTAKPSGDICEPGSSGFVMAVNICTGAIGGLVVTPGVTVGGLGVSASGVLKVSNTYTNSKNQQTIVCNQSDCQSNTPPTLQSTGSPGGRYSWRQLLTR